MANDTTTSTFPFCGLCGGDADGLAHERSDQHQRAGDRVTVLIADRLMECPYCPTTGAKVTKRVPLRRCRNRGHAEAIEACRHRILEREGRSEA